MSELKIYGFSEEQYDNFQRAMIHQEKHPTSGDRYISFRFHIDWLKEWVTEGIVDNDDFWRLLEKFYSSRSMKHNSLEALFNSCLEQIDNTFNHMTVIKIFGTEQDTTDTRDGHMKNINLYLAIIEFARRL
jgi:hypothetical protein